MANFTELRALIDEAEKAYRQRGIGRQMIQQAHHILSKMEKETKALPVWLQNYHIRLREALTYENYDDA